MGIWVPARPELLGGRGSGTVVVVAAGGVGGDRRGLNLDSATHLLWDLEPMTYLGLSFLVCKVV